MDGADSFVRWKGTFVRDAVSKKGDFRLQLAQDALGGDDLHRSQRAVVRECGNEVRDLLEFMENQDNVIDDEEAEVSAI